MKQLYYRIYLNLSDANCLVVNEAIKMKSDHKTSEKARDAIKRNADKIKAIKLPNNVKATSVSIVEILDLDTSFNTHEVERRLIDAL